MSTSRRSLIITGPTASGKTDLAESIAQRVGGEIVNIDVGQFYTALTVGTAKPDWRSKPFDCHLFDILDTPTELSAAACRSKIIALVEDIQTRGKLPIIVGGSMFYIKSLFYPPHQHPIITKETSRFTGLLDTRAEVLDNNLSSHDLWKKLEVIDPLRAQALHQNDRYRVMRALEIWATTGKKPSSFHPIFSPPFPAHVIFLTPPKDVLSGRINQRTKNMINSGGWIAEAKNLLGTEWENFIELKGIIGYTQIFEYLRVMGQQIGVPQEVDENVIAHIAQETRQYAKRQMVFAKKLKSQLEEDVKSSSTVITIQEIAEVDMATADLL